MTKPIGKKKLAQIAAFTYDRDVLALDTVIKWLKKRNEISRIETTFSLINRLEELRAEAAVAVGTKSWSWD